MNKVCVPDHDLDVTQVSGGSDSGEPLGACDLTQAYDALVDSTSHLIERVANAMKPS